MIILPEDGESREDFLKRAAETLDSLRFGAVDEAWQKAMWTSPDEEEGRAFCPTGEGHGVDNSCSAKDGRPGAEKAPPSKSSAKPEKEPKYYEKVDGKRVEITSKTQDVMLAGGKTTMQLDNEMRTAAHEDAAKSRPNGGSTADLWDREFVTRSPIGKMIAATHGPFSIDRTIMGGTYVSHEDIAQFLSHRHEDQRKEHGGSIGETGIIDTTRVLSDEQFDYLVESITDDTRHAYAHGGFDPGFYSHDLEDAMAKMATRHPELNDDKDAKFVFTMLMAITSNGQDPNTNIVDADALYRMWKEHGSVIPSKGQPVGDADGVDDGEEESSAGGNRDVRKSLALFQTMIDSFGVERTRNLMSGTTTVDKLNMALKRMSEKTGNPEWLARSGGKAWLADRYSQTARSKTDLVDQVLKPKPGGASEGSGEYGDEVVPMSSIFGPKIGSFYANLTGRHDFLTMDRWLMRSVGRVTGELLTRSSTSTAAKQAKRALAVFKSTTSSKILFGVENKGVSREDVIRSLQIQAKTGVIEENGAAYLWAKAAERSYKNTPKNHETGTGTFGKSEDKRHGKYINEAHAAGNTIFKNLVYEQQVPRGAQARRSIREVFRAVRDNIEREQGKKVEVDEVQAIMWQYEKNLWKHLGGKVLIEKNSLFSKAADKLLASTDIKTLKPEKTKTAEEVLKEKRSEDGLDAADDDYDVYQFGAEQAYWDSDMQESEADFLELFRDLEGHGDDDTDPDTDPEDPESRACVKQSDGKFGQGNDCAAGDGGPAPKVTVDKTWKKSDESVMYDEESLAESPPAKSLRNARAVLIPDGRTLSKSLHILGISLDDVAKVGGATQHGTEIAIGHGSMHNLISMMGDPSDRIPDGQVTVLGKRDAAGIKDAMAAGVTIWRDAEDEDRLKVAFEFFGVSPEARDKASISVGREMMRGVTESISHAAKMGADEITMFAAGNDRHKEFKGYRIWPRIGFDGVIPRRLVTPSWTPMSGFFATYGSSIPDSALSPRAKEEAAKGKLTVQALWETKEGQRWWERNGGPMDMSLKPSDKESLGWKRFSALRENRDYEEMWIELRAFCPTGPDGGQDNSCSSSDGHGEADWGNSGRDEEVYKPEDGLFKGSDKLGPVLIRFPDRMKRMMRDTKVGLDDAVRAAGINPPTLDRVGCRPPDVIVSPGYDGTIEVNWTTDRGDDSEGGIECSRNIYRDHKGDLVVRMDGFFIDDKELRGKGIALEALLMSVSNQDIRKLVMSASRYDVEPGDEEVGFVAMIGYQHWPKYGFNASIDKVKEVMRDQKLPKEFAKCKDLLDIYATPGGYEWWKQFGDDIDLTFDNKQRSKSRECLLKVARHAREKFGGEK